MMSGRRHYMRRLKIGGAGPTIWPALRAVRSNSTSVVVPIAALLKADCWLSINSWSSANRSSMSVADTVLPPSPPQAFRAVANI